MSVNKVMGVYIDCVGFEDAVYAVQHMLARLIFEAYSNLEACVAGIHTTYTHSFTDVFCFIIHVYHELWHNYKCTLTYKRTLLYKRMPRRWNTFY